MNRVKYYMKNIYFNPLVFRRKYPTIKKRRFSTVPTPENNDGPTPIDILRLSAVFLAGGLMVEFLQTANDRLEGKKK